METKKYTIICTNKQKLVQVSTMPLVVIYTSLRLMRLSAQWTFACILECHYCCWDDLCLQDTFHHKSKTGVQTMKRTKYKLVICRPDCRSKPVAHAVLLWVPYCGWREGKLVSLTSYYLHSNRHNAQFQ